MILSAQRQSDTVFLETENYKRLLRPRCLANLCSQFELLPTGKMLIDSFIANKHLIIATLRQKSSILLAATLMQIGIQFFDSSMKNTIYTVINLKRNVIDFSDQKLGVECSKQVSLNETQKIEQLRLRSNNLTAKEVLPICRMNWNKLNLLYLTLNDIGNIGCKHISKMHLPCIAKLGLGQNNIESAGIIHLAKGIWPTLQQIYLFDNKIGEGSVGLLMRANWPKLKQLLVQSNKLGHSQVFQFFLSRHSSFRSLRISPNGLDKYQLMHKINKNRKLKKKFIAKFQGIVIKIDE